MKKKKKPPPKIYYPVETDTEICFAGAMDHMQVEIKRERERATK